MFNLSLLESFMINWPTFLCYDVSFLPYGVKITRKSGNQVEFLRLLISLMFILACWRWADIKNWKRYYPTIQFMIISQLLYRFFTNGHYYLWKLEKDIFLLNHTFSFLIVTFIVFPCTVILFLTHYPKKGPKQLMYIIEWTGLYIAIEVVMHTLGTITYHHGWNLWWSLGFDTTIFPMLRLHALFPLLTWAISALLISFYLIHFHFPLP